MLKVQLFLKNGGHRSQQTESIVTNFLKWFVTEPRSYIKERRERRQWVRFWLRKTDSKGAYYSIINDLRLTNNEDFKKKIRKKNIGSLSYTLILFK